MWVTLATMALSPLAGVFGSCRFLAKMEQVHETPTPEMAFILGASITTANILFAFVLITLNHYQ